MPNSVSDSRNRIKYRIEIKYRTEIKYFFSTLQEDKKDDKERVEREECIRGSRSIYQYVSVRGSRTVGSQEVKYTLIGFLFRHPHHSLFCHPFSFLLLLFLPFLDLCGYEKFLGKKKY